MRSAALLAGVGLSLIALAGFALSAVFGVHAQATTTIQVGDIWFCDPENSACMTSDLDDIDIVSTISVGDTVNWEWVGSPYVRHSTTACSSSAFDTCGAAQGWDSGEMLSGDFTYTFTTAATIYYKCTVHPRLMRGVITVLAAEPTLTPSPTPTPTPTPQPSPGPSPQPTPQSSPQVLTVESTPSARPAAVDAQAVAIPAGGGEPPSGGGASVPWWLPLAGGGLLVATAALSLRRLYR